MKKVIKGLLLAGAVVGLFSCSNEDGFRTSDGDGKILLDLRSDGNVISSTRADDTKVSVVPEPSQFAIALEKQDGSFSKKYLNMDAFNRESAFPIGTYTLSATYGDMEQEGFELPYFSASQEVLVAAGEESKVYLTATLANCMVSVRYKEEFTKLFSAYGASLKSESSPETSRIAFAANEERPAYMKPEVIELRLSMTNSQGKSVEVAPFSFTALPRTHYILNIGVNQSSGTGDITLNVEITEEVESEFVEVPLGDALFNAPAPSVKAYGFPDSMNYDELQGFIPTGEPKIDVLAYRGLRDVYLYVTPSATTKELPFGKSVQLVGADESTQHLLAASGLVAEGFFRNPDKAGVIKFKDFLSQLPAGEYTISVEATDATGVVSGEKVSFKVTVHPVEVSMRMVKAPDFMGDEMTVGITTNNPDLKSQLRFRVANDAGDFVDSKILEAPAAIRTRATGEYTYNYRISVPSLKKDKIRVQTILGADNKVMATVEEEGLVFPEYTVETDAFANKVWIKVTAADPAKQSIVYDTFGIIEDGKSLGHSLEKIDKEKGIYELTGLTPSTTYSSYAGFLADINNPSQSIASFTTESATDITNGDFSSSTQTINFSRVQVGGKYQSKVGITYTYTILSSIIRNTPNSWANLNELTCWENSTNNTWFRVPSTYEEGGKVVIQTVGYKHDGIVPATTRNEGSWYCTNTPGDSGLDKASGELFLGSYSFDGSEHRVDGIEWSTRPSKMIFDYEYLSYNGEEGEAYVEVKDKDGNILASGKTYLTNGSNLSTEVNLSGYSFGKKAAKLLIGFRSTKKGVNPKVHIPSGKELDEGAGRPVTPYETILDPNTYHTVALGSKLTIDNVKLGYGASTANAVKRKAMKVVKKNK